MALGNSLHLKQSKMSQNASPEIRIIRDINNMPEGKMQATFMKYIEIQYWFWYDSGTA